MSDEMVRLDAQQFDRAFRDVQEFCDKFGRAVNTIDALFRQMSLGVAFTPEQITDLRAGLAELRTEETRAWRTFAQLRRDLQQALELERKRNTP